MSYNGSGTFQINTSGQPVVAGTVISSTAFNALTADLATGLSTAITKDGQTTATARIPFAQGINSTLTTDSSSVSTGSIITAGGVGIAKALYVGTNANVAGTLGVTGVATFSAAPIYSSLTASSAVATDASKALVSVTNTGTGNNVLATSPTLVTPVLGAASATSITFDAGAVGTPSITTTGDTNTGIFFPAADTIAFAEGGAEAMRIDSDGDVGIGTTSPAGRLDVSQSTAGVARHYLRNTNSGTGAFTILDLVNDSGNNIGEFFCTSSTNTSAFGTNATVLQAATSNPLILGTNGTERMRIDSGGNFDFKSGSLTSTGTQNNTTGAGANMFISAGQMYRSTSSLKYKTDVNDATHGLTDLLKLRSVTYKGKRDGDTIFGGLIAEEVDAAGLSEFVQYSADGSPDALAYGNMVSLCIKAIQEQQALITALTAQITAQQASLDSLTARITALEAK
jgi:hypothetical protein